MHTTAYIDADSGIVAASYAVEKPIEWSDKFWTLHAEQSDAEAIFKNWLEGITKGTAIDVGDMLICLSAPKRRYWRHRLCPTYKANRSGGRKPVCFNGLREWVIDNYNTIVLTGQEADDVLGVNANNGILVSIDKDLKTVPGEHFNPSKPELGMVTVDQEEADFNHMVQALMGDSTDGYGGCPGVGIVGATKALKDLRGSVPAMWEQVKELYIKKGLSEKEALMTAQVAYILRPGDIKDDGISLWSPPE